jgi:O-antigen/teichoic acid export membrane protein
LKAMERHRPRAVPRRVRSQLAMTALGSALLKNRSVLLLIEQACNSMWGFILGAIIARWSNIAIFGAFAMAMAVYYVTTSAVAAMTTSIVVVDIARLDKARQAFLFHARQAAERLALPSILVGVGALWLVRPAIGDDALSAALIGSVYLAINVLVDIRRRFLGIGICAPHLAAVSAARTVGLAFSAAIGWAFFHPDQRLAFILLAALLISAVHYLALGAVANRLPAPGRNLGRIAMLRQFRLGIWLFGSMIATSAFEQGVAIYSGAVGGPEITGGWRAGSYLFAFLGILSQLIELMLPDYLRQWLGRRPTRSVLSVYALASVTAAGALSFVIAVVNAHVWLPFLGDSYKDYAYVSYWYGLNFTCIMARTAIGPFLKTRRPQEIFAASLLANLVGLIVFVLTPAISAWSVCVVGLAVNATNFLVNALSLLLISTPRSAPAVTERQS